MDASFAPEEERTVYRVLIADALGREGLDFLAAQKDVEMDVRVGVQGDELAEALRRADALIVRSGAKVTAEVLADPGKLKCFARAGVGVDNIDVETATAKGIIVIPKASSEKHLRSNLAAASLKISETDMDRIDSFGEHRRFVDWPGKHYPLE